MTSSLYPSIDSHYIKAFQFSSWYPHFARHSIKSTILHDIDDTFWEYLNAEGVIVPDENDNDDDESSDDEDEDERERYSFPTLSQRIRECVSQYDAVFPKLNFSSPKDASWVLPSSNPLKCTSPTDVYMLLKSSDFISHDLDPSLVFAGCSDGPREIEYKLELVLRKWYPIDKGRELRCFVRDNWLIGISQRDTNYYEHMNEPKTQDQVIETVSMFWESHIKQYWSPHQHYTFDFLLTRDLKRGHIIDFNPYAPRTDPLLFTYEQLQNLSDHPEHNPHLQVVDSLTHPAASCQTPANRHNMIPFEALTLSDGRDIEEFAQVWRRETGKATKDEDSDREEW